VDRGDDLPWTGVLSRDSLRAATSASPGLRLCCARHRRSSRRPGRAALVTRGNDWCLADPDNVPGLAAETLIVEIGENVARLSAQTTPAHPQIPWSLIKRVRDCLAHHDEGTDRGCPGHARSRPADHQGLPAIARDRLKHDPSPRLPPHEFCIETGTCSADPDAERSRGTAGASTAGARSPDIDCRVQHREQRRIGGAR